MANRWGNNGNSDRLYFLCSKITADGDCSHEIKRLLLLERKAMTNLDKGPSSQSYGFSSSHVWMWELDCEESWTLKNWCFWTVVLEKTLESTLNCKIKPANPKGNQSWIFIGQTGTEANTPILWPPDAKNWLSGKDPDAGRDWRLEEKGTTEDEMAGWQHWLNGCESGWAPRVGDGQGGLRAVIHGIAKSQTRLSDWTELNWTDMFYALIGFTYCALDLVMWGVARSWHDWVEM